MVIELEEMKTRSTTSSVEILGNQCAPLQYIRELTQNSIEAIEQSGKDGQIVWTYDRQYMKEKGIRKLSIIDNGVGMDGEELRKLMNHMFSSGKQQGLTENFGIGAKVSGLMHSPDGMVYKVWKEGKGYLGILMKHPENDQYGLLQHELEDGDLSPYIEIDSSLKPEFKRCTVTNHGTQVTLLGVQPEQDTYLPKDAVYGPNWLARYLNCRYLSVPENVELAVSCNVHKNEDGTPKYQIRMIKGMRYYNEKYSTHSGVLPIKGAKVHWWVLEGLKNPRPEFPSVSHSASIFQGELYDYEENTTQNMTRLHRFGIIQLVKRVVIYVEPTNQKVTADPSRSFVTLGSAQKIPWDEWGDEFAANMPEELRQLEEEASEKATDEDLSKDAEKILRDWMKDFEIPKYAVEADAEIEVSEPTDLGGMPDSGDLDDSRPGEEDSESNSNGKTGNQYSDFIKPKGREGKETKGQDFIPKVEWVSPEDHPALDDRAAQYIRIHNRLLINEEFRGFTQLVNTILADKGGNKPGAKAVVVEAAKLHYQVSLCETILRIQMLKKGGRTWKQDDVDDALGPLALTTSVMSHKLLHEKITRLASSKIGKAIKKAAEPDPPSA